MAKPQATSGRRVDWFASALGLLLAVAIELTGTNLLFGSHHPSLISQGALTFVALIAGGALAGVLGPLGGGVWNGVIVAIGFIVVDEIAGDVVPVGRFGSQGLDTLGLIVNDVLILSGGTIGGLLAGAARRLKPR
jgi:hypothetical protein